MPEFDVCLSDFNFSVSEVGVYWPFIVLFCTSLIMGDFTWALVNWIFLFTKCLFRGWTKQTAICRYFIFRLCLAKKRRLHTFHANEANEAPENVFTLLVSLSWLKMAMGFVAFNKAKTHFAIHSWTKMKYGSVKLWNFVIYNIFGNYFPKLIPHKCGYIAHNSSHVNEIPMIFRIWLHMN